MKNQNLKYYFLLLCTGILVIFLFSVKLGTVSLTWQEFRDGVFEPKPENLASLVIWHVRMPRFFLGLLSGGLLAVAGQGMQILVRNPLADPYTMGTASGASLGINLALSGILPGAMISVLFLPFYAFAGALGSSALVLLWVSGKQDPENTRFLLVGVAVSILANSLVSVITFLAARQSEVRHLLFWTFGNLDKAGWDTLVPVACISIPALGLILAFRKSWTLLLLGDEKAESLGVSAIRLKRILLILCSFLTACVVSVAGPIGFAGLLVPYWSRKVLPISDPRFWPLTFLGGAFFISGCDLLSRILFQPYGLPIGLVTALVGVPFFLYLLRETARKSAF